MLFSGFFFCWSHVVVVWSQHFCLEYWNTNKDSNYHCHFLCLISLMSNISYVVGYNMVLISFHFVSSHVLKSLSSRFVSSHLMFWNLCPLISPHLISALIFWHLLTSHLSHHMSTLTTSHIISDLMSFYHISCCVIRWVSHLMQLLSSHLFLILLSHFSHVMLFHLISSLIYQLWFYGISKHLVSCLLSSHEISVFSFCLISII